MKPIIGVIGKVIENEGKSIVMSFEGIRRGIIRYGGIPVLILPNQDIDYLSDKSGNLPKLTAEEKEDLKRIIDTCDGIIMPGTNYLFDYDNFIYTYALEKDIPILGICGGMQLMSLCDIGEEEQTLTLIESSINHKQPDVDYVHKVILDEDSLLYKIVGEKEIMVNSRHRYCINGVKNMKVCGMSEDGFMEAIEYSDRKFVIGFQWHPETMYTYDEPSRKIFEYFINACKE